MLFTRLYVQGLFNSGSILRFSSTVKIIEIYTDGSCYNNGTPLAKGGYAVYFPGAEHPNICKTNTQTYITSPRCEILAVQSALSIYDTKMRGKTCNIYTDSMYIIDSLYRYSPVWRKNGWKKIDGTPVKNQDLMKPLCELFEANKDYVSIKHVKAHSMKYDRHSLNNGVADLLAKNGVYPCDLVIDALSKCSHLRGANDELNK